VYKIVDSPQWEAIQSGSPWSGAPVDHADGFMHFSASDQVQGTLEKHFAGLTGLRVLEIPIDRLDADALRWEVSRNGDLFPHLYGTIHQGQVATAHGVTGHASGGFEALKLCR
jgi:uncharacterized protein (DUF952 family)